VPWTNKELSLDFFKRTLTVDLLENHVKRVTMCGDIGDPIYASEFIEIIEYIKSVNPRIHIFTITNGSYRKAEWWRRFAAVSNEYDTVNFSVDGYDSTSNNLYRVNSNWDSIMQGMQIMAQESLAYVNWAAIVFAFNQDHLDTIRHLAKDIGCDGLQLTYSTKFGSKYGSYGENDPLEPRVEFISKTHRYERYFENLSSRQVNNLEYLEHNKQRYLAVKAKHNSVITPMCAIGNRGLYVSADGVLHPCSWVSFPYTSLSTNRKTIYFKDSFHQQYRSQLNLSIRTLNEIVTDPVWDKLFATFDNTKRAWVECEQKCGSELVDESYAVGWYTN
jgi:MoaA/NifB/PqqE/SkfB family radical SAM enzyme